MNPTTTTSSANALLLLTLLLGVAPSGCGRSDRSSPTVGTSTAVGATAARPAATALPTAAEAATVVGVIRFDGPPPPAERIPVGSEAACAKVHPDGLLAEALVVSPTGGLANVFVRIADYAGPRPPVPSEPVLLDQQGCSYRPHVFGVRAGQPIRIRNGDDAIHNVRALAESQGGFNLMMMSGGPALEKTFDLPEVMVRFKCDVHPWMAAWCGVVDHPFFAVTGPDGAFRIGGLPAGSWTLEAWHELLGTQRLEVRLDRAATAPVELRFALSAR